LSADKIKEKRIIKKIETIYKLILKKYIERQNFPKMQTVYFVKDINLILDNSYTAFYFYVNNNKWLHLRFNKNDKLIDVSWLEPKLGKRKIVYKDFVYAYKRVKELGVMLV
jgi:hypothetical protein